MKKRFLFSRCIIISTLAFIFISCDFQRSAKITVKNVTEKITVEITVNNEIKMVDSDSSALWDITWRGSSVKTVTIISKASRTEETTITRIQEVTLSNGDDKVYSY